MILETIQYNHYDVFIFLISTSEFDWFCFLKNNYKKFFDYILDYNRYNMMDWLLKKCTRIYHLDEHWMKNILNRAIECKRDDMFKLLLNRIINY